MTPPRQPHALFTTTDNRRFTHVDSGFTAYVYVQHNGWAWSVTGMVTSLVDGFARRKRQAMRQALNAMHEWRARVC